MPDAADELEPDDAALAREHADLCARLQLLRELYLRTLAEQEHASTQEAIAQNLGISRDEVRLHLRRGLLKARRAFDRLLENPPA